MGDASVREKRERAGKAPAALQKSQPAERQERPAEGKSEARPGDDKGSEAANPRPRRGLLYLAIGLLAAAVLGVAGYVYWDHTSHFETTDDAFIVGRLSSVVQPKYMIAVGAIFIAMSMYGLTNV